MTPITFREVLSVLAEAAVLLFFLAAAGALLLMAWAVMGPS